jgi:hypothetical protein
VLVHPRTQFTSLVYIVLLRCVHLFVHVWCIIRLSLSKCIKCMIALFRQRAARGVAEDLPKQQLGEGKCPLTYYVLLT